MINSPTFKKILCFIGHPYCAKHRKWSLMFAACFIVVLDLLVGKEHPIFFWDYIPARDAFFGFVFTLIIVLLAKFLANRCGIKQREDYYD